MAILNQSWYRVNELEEKIWEINDNGQDTIYLIEGKEKALLIDTGWGIGNLFELVSTLTRLPLLVVNTHCHPDHVCGNYQFDHVYIHKNDVSMMKGNFTKEARIWMIDNILNSALLYDFPKEAWINANLKSISIFDKNLVFDLGGRTIKVIETPGHSPGSICLFVPDEGILFTGDTIEEGDIWLHCEECLPLSVYFKGIKEFISIKDEIKYLFPAHGKTPIKPDILLELYNGIEKILSGRSKGIKHETFLGNGLLCRFDSCGILYREDNM